jgi:hypothetical protein
VCVLNWPGDLLPKEANNIRPCVIVEDTDLFAGEHPNVIVVPLTTNASTIVSQLGACRRMHVDRFGAECFDDTRRDEGATP